MPSVKFSLKMSTEWFQGIANKSKSIIVVPQRQEI